jgi:hypothetical protein
MLYGQQLMSGKTFGPQYEIDLAGRKYFEALGQAHWTTRERTPDVHIDYEIELRDGSEPSGLTAYVQLKSQRVTKRSGEMGTVRVPRKHLQYYHLKAETPVFLVLVDTTAQEGWFLFVQEWLKASNILGKNRRADDITVHVQLAQRIDDYPAFLSAVRKARAYMRELRPGSPEAAVAAATAKYSEIDPRFDYSLRVDKSGRCLEMKPKFGDIELKLSVKASGQGAEQQKAKQMLDQIFGYGRKGVLHGVEITVTGSPLFDGKTIAAFEFEPSGIKKGFVEIFSDETESKSISFPCEYSGGLSGISIVFDDPNCPLVMTHKIPKELFTGKDGGDLNIRIDHDRWVGKPILSLPWFDSVFGFFEAASSRHKLTLRFSVEGNYSGRCSIVLPERSMANDQHSWCDLLMKARRLAEHGGVNPNLPSFDKVPENEIDHIEIGYNLLTTGSHQLYKHPFEVPLNITTPDAVLAISNLSPNQKCSFVMAGRGQRLNFFGVSVLIGQYVIDVSNVTMKVRPEDVERATKEHCGAPTFCQSTEEGVMIARLGKTLDDKESTTLSVPQRS